MRPSLSSGKERGLTLIEIFVILAVIAALAALLLPAFLNAKKFAQRINCVYNLKTIGLAYRVWAGDNSNSYPMQLSSTNGGTMEFITGANAFRHYQAMSNELSTPRVLLCPADENSRTFATNFTSLNNSNLSYFVGIDATETNAQGLLMLTGDHNITNGNPVRNGILELTKNRSAGWTGEMHSRIGNLGMADGSVQQVNIRGLRNAVANTGLATNRLQMPAVGP